MTPTKIILEKTASCVQLRVFAPETLKGSMVIEGTPFAVGGPKQKTMDHLRKSGIRYAKRFAIPFIDLSI